MKKAILPKWKKLLEWIDLRELKKLRWQNLLLLVAAGCIPNSV